MDSDFYRVLKRGHIISSLFLAERLYSLGTIPILFFICDPSIQRTLQSTPVTYRPRPRRKSSKRKRDDEVEDPDVAKFNLGSQKPDR